MKKLKSLSLLLALAMLAVAMLGCSAPAKEAGATATPDVQVTETPQAESNKITVTDMAQREITLDGQATKIVALTASDCEILYAIGAGDLLVGRGEYCNYPEEVMNVASVQSGYETNIEQIIALAPDVVVMAIMSQTEEQVQSLENAGIKVIVTDAQKIEDVYEEIRLLGTITGKSSEAETLVSTMKAGFEQIARSKPGEGTKTVYFEVSPLEYGLWAAGSGTFMDEIATMLGLTNAFADVSGWGEISEEQVIERDPDYIVTISMYFGEGPTPVEEIMQRAGWQDLKAIKNAAVFNADSDQISRPGPRLVDAAMALSEFVSAN